MIKTVAILTAFVIFLIIGEYLWQGAFMPSFIANVLFAFIVYYLDHEDYQRYKPRERIEDVPKSGSHEDTYNETYNETYNPHDESHDNVYDGAGNHNKTQYDADRNKILFSKSGKHPLPPRYNQDKEKSFDYKPDEFIYDEEYKMIAERIIKRSDSIEVSRDMVQSALDTLGVFHGKKYNRCWVAEYLPYWNSKLLKQVNKWSHKDPIKFLQIGVFEGLSLIYLTKHIFAGHKLEITVIDDFSTEPYFNTEETFRANTADMDVRIIKKQSHPALLELIDEGEKAQPLQGKLPQGKKFDFVYCSGSRKPSVCYVDFALLSMVMSDNGMILLDTYDAYSSYEGEISPTVARSAFTGSFARFSDVKKIGAQRLMMFKPVAVDKWVMKEKPADCKPK
jgi:hypothetical protein